MARYSLFVLKVPLNTNQHSLIYSYSWWYFCYTYESWL